MPGKMGVHGYGEEDRPASSYGGRIKTQKMPSSHDDHPTPAKPGMGSDRLYG
ncbi:hypothetical protein ACPOL_5105 [Acidisarcina polymorpha]|uniref:Uncharacterized protein n=1 Tax=Acidisarcina polymorpha TaxID=2211140 RepID=A0A2Z5G5J5_9BACT|nr:hypothetical protein ACPOL_5105 [Acidisarcina polymorpha]